MTRNETRYSELDALRGLAALMVVLYHFTMNSEEGRNIFNVGNTGVDLFFMISGFVISLTIGNVSKAVHFVINRVSRLYPTYWTCVTLTFLVGLAYNLHKGNEIQWVDYIGNMTMFQYYFQISDLDRSYWTMFVEMQFYVIVLLLFVTGMLKRIRTIGVVTCIALVVIVNRFWNGTTDIIFQHIRLLAFFPLFFAGMLFYRIKTEARNWSMDYLLVLFCLLTQLLIADYGARTKQFISLTEYSTMLVIYFTLFALFVNNALWFIVTKPTLFLGKISFALYLIHQSISVDYVIPYLTNALHVNFWAASMLICLPFCIVLAASITYFVEIPLSKKFRTSLYRLTTN